MTEITERLADSETYC